MRPNPNPDPTPNQALGEGMNGYRPIVELMNTNFGIYAMAEISSAGTPAVRVRVRVRVKVKVRNRVGCLT